MPGKTYSAPFFNAKNLLERKSLGEFLTELDALSGPLAGPAKPPELVKFNTSDTVGAAMRNLASYNVLAAPVSDAVSGEYVGMIDVADLLKGLIKGIYPELLEQGYLQSHKRLSISELQSVGLEFTSKKLSSLLHGGDLWYKGDAESNLLEVVESGFRVGVPSKLHAPHHHLRVHHRVAVFDILPGEQTPDGPIPEWRITDIISQTDVLRFVMSHVDRLDPAFNRTLAELGLVQGDVNAVAADTPALTVFATMHKKGLSGIAITESEGGLLVGNLSMSDLRGLTPDRFGALALPIGAFVLLQNKKGISWDDAVLDNMPPDVKEGRWREALSTLPLVTCSPDTPLREAMQKLVEYRKHRVWVVDGEGKAVGVVTPTDMLRLIIS